MSYVVNNYQEINLTANITLQWTFTFGSADVISRINDINPNANGYTITLPPANAGAVPLGQDVLFNNISTYSFSVLDNAGNVLQLIAAGKVYYFYLYDTTTAAGQWRVTLFGSGTSAITALTAQSSDNSITITNGNLTPPGGTINFQLPTSLYNLNNSVSSIGFPVLTGKSPKTWGSVTFTGGTNISITNPTGVNNGSAANPIFDLDTTITGLDSITVGNVTISGDNILNTNDGQDLTITTDGTANIVFNKYVKIDSSGNLIVNGGFNNPFTPKAWCIFTDTGPSNTINIQSNSNVSSVTRTSAGTYQINFTTAMNIENYAVFFSLGNTGTIPRAAGTPSTAFWLTRNETYVTISVVDASGTPVATNQYGTAVLIMSTP